MPERDQLYVNFVGTWKGTLEYKDYQDSTRRVTLPTDLDVLPAPDQDGLELRYTYDDGPGKIVKSIDHLHFDRAMTSARWGDAAKKELQAFVVTGREGGRNGAPLRLVLETQGSDNNVPATIRETLELSAASVRILKETRVVGGEFAFRHTYVFRRAQ